MLYSFTLSIVLVLFSLDACLAREEQAPCETGQVICPRGTRCVAGTGCVPTNTTTCRCPEHACVWPQECNCKGACALRECSATKACSHSVNPANACEVTVCRQAKCVSAALACDKCNPKTGCPKVSGGGTRDVPHTTDGATTDEEEPKGEPKVKDVGDGEPKVKDVAVALEGDDVELESWWHQKRGIVIGFGCLIGVAGGSMLALAIYFAFITTRS